jgi:hypothetical protein
MLTRDDDDEGVVQYQDPMQNFQIQAQIDRFDASKAIIWSISVENDFKDRIANRVMKQVEITNRKLKIPAS